MFSRDDSGHKRHRLKNSGLYRKFNKVIRQLNNVAIQLARVIRFS